MNSSLTTASAPEAAATRVRFRVLGFACSLSMITYLDRVCFGAAATHLVNALEQNTIGDLALAQTAFAISYAAFEIPSGWLGDVFGPKRTLIRIVLWWSVFTALTGFVGLSMGTAALGFTSLVLIRFFFGMGEAGAYPNITRALHNWLPLGERGFGQGAVWMAGRLMGGLTPLLWVLIVEDAGLSWRTAFWLFGGLGVVWCLWFGAWFKDRPEQKPEVNEAERQLITGGRTDTEAAHANVPWLKLLACGNLWMLCLMYFCAAYGWYFNIFYLPTFLEQQHNVRPDSRLGAIYKGGPLWMGAAACLAGGWLTDRFIRRTGDRKWGRRLFGVVGHGLCALCYFSCLFAPTALTFFLAISLAAFWNDMTMGAAWATCQDIGKRYAAIVAGFMNTVGNLGGAAATQVTGMILNAKVAEYASEHQVAVTNLTAADKAAALMPGYQINFLIFALVYVVAVFLWLRIDATRPVVPESETHS